MPRAATTTDVFNAIAEPRRREILGVLARKGELEVGALVRALGMTQPAVSKHLGVLRAVGVVSVTTRGRRRLYRLEAQEIKPVFDWAKSFERFWETHLDRIKRAAERRARDVSGSDSSRDAGI